MGTRSVDELLAEAEGQPFKGWDFSWIKDRRILGELPWDYTRMVADLAKDSTDLLDMGTGGGEWLAALTPRPKLTVATESYPPNVPIAARRLRPLGVSVVRTSPARENRVQTSSEILGLLPFRSGSFHLVVNRHESFVAPEVARILAPGGRFMTQQVGAFNEATLFELFDLPSPPEPTPYWELGLARDQVQSAGLKVTGSGEGTYPMAFLDVGALAYYVRAIEWSGLPDFTIRGYRRQFEELNARIFKEGSIVIPQHRFWLEARKEP